MPVRRYTMSARQFGDRIRKLFENGEIGFLKFCDRVIAADGSNNQGSDELRLVVQFRRMTCFMGFGARFAVCFP
jgi:hypothetical protein